MVYCLHTAWAMAVFARYAKLGRISNTGWRELPEPVISVRYCYKQFKEYIRDSRGSICSRFEHSLHIHVSNACWWLASRPKTRFKIETVVRYCFTLRQNLNYTSDVQPAARRSYVWGPQEFSEHNLCFSHQEQGSLPLVIWRASRAQLKMVNDV